LHAVCRTLGNYHDAVPIDVLVVPRSRFSIDDPWRSPHATSPVRLRRATDGRVPRLATTVCLSFDEEYLSIIFSTSDDHIVASHWSHDDPLYEEDVVEVFLAPRDPTGYFEVEVSPLGTIFDARIHSPDGSRETMRVDRAWSSGALAAVRKVSEQDGTMTIDTLIRIPFESLGTGAPKAGELWRANFFRIDRHPDQGDEYSAWRPTMRQPPDFHVPSAFGAIEFRP
jgi:hypothetical protein